MSTKAQPPPEELSKGARWMLNSIDTMQADYKVREVTSVYLRLEGTADYCRCKY